MTVIATDGNAIEPIVVERIVLLNGERFDFVLTATNSNQLSKCLSHFQAILFAMPKRIAEPGGSD